MAAAAAGADFGAGAEAGEGLTLSYRLRHLQQNRDITAERCLYFVSMIKEQYIKSRLLTGF